MPDQIIKNDGVKKQVRLEWQFPEYVVRRYATNILAQAGEHEAIISFFEAQPPIIPGTPEEIAEKAKEIDTVPAICVGSIIVAIDRLPGFASVIQGIYDAVKRNQQQNQEKT